MEAQLTKEEALREKIVQAAQQLFQRFGLRKVTMDDIAKAAGRGKSGLYYYYKSKDEIFDVVIDREITDALQQLELVINRLPTASAKLEAFALAKLHLLSEKSALYGIVYRDIYQHYSLEFTNRICQRYQDKEVAIIERVLLDGVRTQEFRALNSAQVAGTIVASLLGFEQVLFTDGNVAETEANVKLLTQLISAGLKA